MDGQKDSILVLHVSIAVLTHDKNRCWPLM